MKLLPLCILITLLHGASRAANENAVELKDGNIIAAEFRVGTAGKVALKFAFADGKPQSLLGVVKADALKRTIEKDGKKTPEMQPMPDGFIEFSGPGLKFQYHSRPCLIRYTEAQQAELAKTWESLTPASQALVSLEARADDAGAELWMDGRYCGRVASTSKLAGLSIKTEDGGEVRALRSFKREIHDPYLPLEVRRIAHPGVMKEASVSLKSGAQLLKSVPMIVASPSENADVSAAKVMQGPQFLETDQNTSRTSLDAMPESLHFSVPQAFYHRAWVLCAVENDPAKDTVLTTRLTRFGISGRGGAMADTSIELPREDAAPRDGIEHVGSVDYVGANKGKTSVPLYLVRVDLKCGDILDLISDTNDKYAAMKIGPYLDFEFLGKMGGLQVQRDNRRKPVPTSISGVHVFGVTLEKSPVEMRLKQSQPGNIFHNDEQPETSVSLRALRPMKGVLRREVTDVRGTKLMSQDHVVTFAKAGDEEDITFDLSMPELGWYGLRFTLLDDRGAILMMHDAAFALLGKDTRKAGYDSPFGTWWFNGVHYTTRDPAIAGPLLHKAGMRRTTMGWTQDAEPVFAQWQISLNQIKWPFRLADLQDWPAAEARAEKSISEMLRRFPHCRYVDLFHESYDPGAYPPELFGGKYEAKDEAQKKREDDLFELGVRGAIFLRAKFPQLKIIAGNSGGSLGIIALMLRRGFPRELIDYLGSETTGQSIAPEKLSPHTSGGIWLMGETARRFGYDIPLSGCFEFTSRAERDLGAQRLAEWYARDVVIGLAHRFPTISAAEIEDVDNAYYDTLWGGAGLCQRNPLHYPKPAYVALATLTKALDSVTLTRQLDTDSSSAHALEFKRGKEHVYALWTTRGDCDMRVELPSSQALTVTGFYGASRSTPREKTHTLTASSAVSYFTCPVAVSSITAGTRSFALPPSEVQVVAAMDRAEDWQLVADKGELTTDTRKPGSFLLRQQQDAEHGACVELELQKQGELPAVVGEYTGLQLKQPAPIPGRPHSIGMWVKGDSSWGRIFWEIEDAKGERFLSNGGYDGGDWGNYSALDFDGWCFMTFPLTDNSRFTHIEPGSGAKQWKSKGDGRLDYPLKMIGIHVVTHRQSLDLTQMKPVRTPLRFKNLSVIGSTSKP